MLLLLGPVLLMWLPRALNCTVPHVSTRKACVGGSLAGAVMASLALWADMVLLEITLLSLEGLHLPGEPLHILPLGYVHYHSTYPLSLQLWAQLIQCLVLLSLIARQCNAFSLMVRVMGMLALYCLHDGLCNSCTRECRHNRFQTDEQSQYKLNNPLPLR